MSFDPALCLDPILKLSQAAYNPALMPAGWEIVATVQPGDFGFLVANSHPAVSVAAFIIRGTEHLEEWLADFDARPVPDLYGGCGHVARGFQDVYSEIRTSLFRPLLPAFAYDELHVIGHSLGGALSQLFAKELAMRFQRKMTDGPKIVVEPTLWTFESPRPFWMDAVQEFNQLVTEYWRVENRPDIVPHAPPTDAGYQAGGSLVAVSAPFSLDVHVNHSLASVALGLQKLVTS
ncbi:MAG TPA: lipase family protein [Candidatus Sulfotelmatobacter sp.]|nr:lipase family protein [Candidatus Sulfotelmatobacter sp.]